VDGDHFEVIEHAIAFEALDEEGVDRRDAAEHALDGRIDGMDRLGRFGQGRRQHRPVGVDLRVPMRFVVGLVPDHGCFDHSAAFPFAG
jgi:hypothetical protein